ncbi:hypothetical protein BG004_003646 [Podila humilis]|nr:hypothetical protein BG004_003646 [Podila humilis]
MPNDHHQPLNLANLTSTETQQQQHPARDNGVEVTNEKVSTLLSTPTLPTDRDQQPLQQQQPGLDQQQQSHRQSLDPEKHVDTPILAQQTNSNINAKANAHDAGPPSAGGAFGRKLKMASLVDRVKSAQHESTSHDEKQHQDLGSISSHDKNTLDPERHRDSIQLDGQLYPRGISYEHDQRPSIIHNAITPDGSPPLPNHFRNDGASQPAVHHFPKIFSKDGVRNALFLHSATTAFTKSKREKTLNAVDMQISSLAAIGPAIPSLWLRRDDKGRRPSCTNESIAYQVAVTDSEIDPGVGKQIIFRMELQYGDVKWVIKRTLYEFYKLHIYLATKRFDNLPKFPNQVTYAFSVAKATMGMKSEDKIEYLRTTNLARRQALQNYLTTILQGLNWTVAYDLYEFLEISFMSLTKDMGWKGKEAYVDTKITDKTQAICGIGGISRWIKTWAILRDSYMAFCPSVGSDEPTDVFIFDQNFFVQHKEHALGLNLHHIEIGNTFRKIEIKGEHNREMLEWMEHFDKMRQSSPWLYSHRFGSFAPERENAKVRYYVDGKDYFHAVSDAIVAAKTEIYIADWWLSPELYLRRPPEKNEEFRLDRLLKKKAMEGVMIYIVVYKEVSLALTLDSAHTKIWLQDLHKNIQVQRHPDHLKVKGTQFWAHHEKICVIDCRLAFIGGLDLCFGRYDSRTHQLSDYHPSGTGTIWPGLDYSNPRIKDFVNVKDYNSDLIEKKLLARMPWHDVSVGMAGPPARDIARHFVQRWNFVKREKGMKKSHMKFLTPKGEFVSTRNESGWTGSQKVQILRSSTIWSQGVDVERSIQDAYISCIENAKHFIYIENQFFVTLAVEDGNPDIKNLIGLALVNRIVRAHNEGSKFRVIVVMPLMPAFEADIMSSEAGTLRKVMHFQYVSISRGGNSVLERLIAQGVNPDDYIGFFGLRSFDRIKHGKFDAIVEAVREEERRGARAPARTSTTDPAAAIGQSLDTLPDNEPSNDTTQDATTTNTAAPLPAANNKKNAKSKSLAARFLLEPLPTGAEAERIKAVAEKRKATDAAQIWDDSISKKAMNPSKKEQGYIPAATENSMADVQINAQIQRDTDQAEAEAKSSEYRSGGRSSPELVDGFGSIVRNAIEKMKGYKEGGDVEPLRRRLSRNASLHRPHAHRSLHVQHQGQGDHTDPVNIGIDRSRHDSVGNGRDAYNRNPDEQLEEDSQSAKEKAESIVEPIPEQSHQIIQAEPSAESPVESAAGSSSSTIVDDEVNDFVTEQLYIHSKLMIVDDRIIICGSANINDRSQVGYRDSEIAILIEDTEMVPSKMNGVPYQAGKLAHHLRTDLFKEHLGLLPHVEHDVMTKASVLPVDLDAPNKDPEQARLELIRKANEPEEIERRKKQLEFQQQEFLKQPQILQVNQQQEQFAEGQPSTQQQLSQVQVPSEIRTHQEQQHESHPHHQDEHGHGHEHGLREHPFGEGVSSLSVKQQVLDALTPRLFHKHHSNADEEAAEQYDRPQRLMVPVERPHHEGTGRVHEYLPDEEEARAFVKWHSPHERRDAKKAAAADPEAANAIVMDPLHEEFYEGWWKRVATTNTAIFREVFKCVPDDSIETWDDYQAFVPDSKKVLQGHVAMEGATTDNVTAKLQGVTGHLVEFPTRFLQKENLAGGAVQGAVFQLLSLSAVVLSSIVAAAPSTVYFFSHGRPSTSEISRDQATPQLSIPETRATLTHLLNLGTWSHTDAIIDMNGPVQQVFNQPGMTRKNLFETMGGNLIMVVEGVNKAQDLLPSFHPSFTVDNSEGIQDLVGDLAANVASEDRYLFNTHESSKSGDALVNEHLVAEHHRNVDVTVFDLSKKADALFLEESIALGNYIETYEKKHKKHSGSDFVRITIKGLSALATEHGFDSIQYQTAQQILKEFLQLTFIPEFEQIHKTYTTTIFLVAPATRQGSELFAAEGASLAAAQQQQRTRNNMKRALAPSGSCFLTEADCQTNTNACSARGACVLSPAANCYHCQCSKVNNTQYSGTQCEKIDVSVQFHLFFWLVLVLVLTVGMAVGLIVQMGNQTQGGVPLGPTRAQLKRD